MPPATILIVDDDPLIRQLGRELLESQGFRVAIAGDAAQALEVFRGLRRIDLAILDYHLPGVSGLGLVEEIRAQYAGVRVLMASGFISPQEVTRLQENGVQGFIDKPFRLTELLQRIQEALAGAAGD